MSNLPNGFKKEDINKTMLLDAVKDCIKAFEDGAMANIFVVDAIYYQKEVDELLDEPESMDFDDYVQAIDEYFSKDLNLCEYDDVIEKSDNLNNTKLDFHDGEDFTRFDDFHDMEENAMDDDAFRKEVRSTLKPYQIFLNDFKEEDFDFNKGLTYQELADIIANDNK